MTNCLMNIKMWLENFQISSMGWVWSWSL